MASPINGIPLQGWWDRLAAADSQRIEQQLRLGILQGETNDQIVRTMPVVLAGAQSGAVRVDNRLRVGSV